MFSELKIFHFLKDCVLVKVEAMHVMMLTGIEVYLG